MGGPKSPGGSADPIPELPANLPTTVPERRRVDGTMIAAPWRPLTCRPRPTRSAAKAMSMPPDSYQPPGAGSTLGASQNPSTVREQIVPSTSPTDAILVEIRKSPSERLEIESREASGGMGTIDVAVDRALDRRIAVKTLHTHLPLERRRRAHVFSAKRGSPVSSITRTSCRSMTSASATPTISSSP